MQSLAFPFINVLHPEAGRQFKIRGGKGTIFYFRPKAVSLGDYCQRLSYLSKNIEQNDKEFTFNFVEL